MVKFKVTNQQEDFRLQVFFLFQVRAETNKQTFFTTSATIYKLYTTNVQTHAYV